MPWRLYETISFYCSRINLFLKHQRLLVCYFTVYVVWYAARVAWHR